MSRRAREAGLMFDILRRLRIQAELGIEFGVGVGAVAAEPHPVLDGEPVQQADHLVHVGVRLHHDYRPGVVEKAAVRDLQVLRLVAVDCLDSPEALEHLLQLVDRVIPRSRMHSQSPTDRVAVDGSGRVACEPRLQLHVVHPESLDQRQRRRRHLHVFEPGKRVISPDRRLVACSGLDGTQHEVKVRNRLANDAVEPLSGAVVGEVADVELCAVGEHVDIPVPDQHLVSHELGAVELGDGRARLLLVLESDVGYEPLAIEFRDVHVDHLRDLFEVELETLRVHICREAFDAQVPPFVEDLHGIPSIGLPRRPLGIRIPRGPLLLLPAVTSSRRRTLLRFRLPGFVPKDGPSQRREPAAPGTAVAPKARHVLSGEDGWGVARRDGVEVLTRGVDVGGVQRR
mmetsp:Transcript_14784/g.35700  ORF Transcript_14784/g.35700 Transcript_14784/m.35700 type:complete len:400 (-) Transcript_14784:225-1424(-)